MCIEENMLLVSKIHPATSKRSARYKSISKLQLIYEHFFNELNLIFLLDEYLLLNTCRLYLREPINSRQVGLTQEP